ncbi:MAG: Chaperone SurA [Syntrophus sp. SKADARSKE-3]|nr:Chaperone SurA [Syntrophus sp. SKADARSKE-3]
MKRKYLFFVAVVFYLMGSGELYAAVTDRIIAVVNGDAITLYELNMAFEPLLKRINDNYNGPNKEQVVAEARKSMLNRLIVDRLIDQEAKKYGTTMKDDDVMSTIRGMLASQNMTMEQFQARLAKGGLTFEQYKERTREQLLKTRILKFEVNYKVSVSDEEIGEYYRKHRDEYEGKDAVRIKQILLPFPKDADRRQREKLKEQAEIIHKEFIAGNAFNAVAVKYAKNPQVVAMGDMGFLEKGTMVSEVDQIAFRLNVNEISPVIESPMGYHIIQVTDKRGEGLKSIEAVRNEIKLKIEEEKMEKKFEEWVDGLKKKSLIEIKS